MVVVLVVAVVAVVVVLPCTSLVADVVGGLRLRVIPCCAWSWRRWRTKRTRGDGGVEEAALAFAIWRSPSPPARPHSETVDGLGLVVETVEFQFKMVRASLYKLVGAWLKLLRPTWKQFGSRNCWHC